MMKTCILFVLATIPVSAQPRVLRQWSDAIQEVVEAVDPSVLQVITRG